MGFMDFALGAAKGAFTGAVMSADFDRQTALDQAKNDLEMKRQTALENLRHQNTEAGKQADYETRGGKEKQAADIAAAGASAEASRASARVNNANADAAPALKDAQIKNYESEAKYREGMLKNNADKIAMMYENGQLKSQLAAAQADKKLPEEIKLAMQGRFKAIEEVFKDTTLDDEGRKQRIAAVDKTFGPQLVKQAEVNDKTGAVTIQSWDGRVQTFKDRAEALAAYGMAPPPAAKSDKPAAAASPARAALDKPAEPPYTPPADSPAAKVAAMRQSALDEQTAKSQATATSAKELAEAALKSGDPADAQAAQDAPGFNKLPIMMRQQIRNLVFGK